MGVLVYLDKKTSEKTALKDINLVIEDFLLADIGVGYHEEHLVYGTFRL